MKGRGNQVRIIGGECRGRKLHFPDARGLRPTADRVRETLFNWLQPVIRGSRCLDLFAGSGALGLEALSRRAAWVLFCEQARPVALKLRENVQLLGMAERSEVRVGDGLRLLQGAPERPFDIVFLDPPFADRLLPRLLQRLEQGGWLAPVASIYLEQDSHHAWPPLPSGWAVYREGRAGQAAFRLLRRDMMPAENNATD